MNQAEQDDERADRVASAPNLSLKVHRDRLGLTQQEVADALLALAWEQDHERLGVDAGMISKWERGLKRPRKLYRRLLCRLYGATEEQLGLHWAQLPAADASDAEFLQRIAGMAVLSGGTSSAAARRLPGETSSNMQALSHEAAVAQVAHVHCCYQAAQYRTVAGWLPSLIESVDALVAEGAQARRREALKLQGSLSVMTAKLATRLGDAPLAWRAANRAKTSALQADDPFGQAAAAYQLACALLLSGRREEAEQTALRSGEAITGADPRSWTWRGALMLISALIAARRQHRSCAEQRLEQARRLAEQLGADANIGWTAFGPTNVLIHRMSAAVALEDPQAVLTVAERVDIRLIPDALRGRQAQFHLESAWAYVRLNEDPFALIHLLDAERVAPQLVHSNASSHGLIRQLLSRERRGRVPGLRSLAERAGVLV